jgi:hypothetical protein
VSGGLPFFVMDTRTERTLREASVKVTHACMIGPRQIDALKRWLKQQQHGANKEKPKFIVSGSVLAPVPRNFTELPWMYRSNDDWAGYPATWHELVRHIIEEQIQNVVFISGDYHFSAVAKLTLNSDAYFGGKQPVVAYSIVASGLFAPLPFASGKREDFDWGGARPIWLPFSDGDAAIKVEPYFLTASSSHFARVDARPVHGGSWEIGVSAYDCAGIIKPDIGIAGPFHVEKNVVRWAL